MLNPYEIQSKYRYDLTLGTNQQDDLESPTVLGRGCESNPGWVPVSTHGSWSEWCKSENIKAF
jgi:hypothetical protein